MKKTVGIIGFGIVGRSYADFLLDRKECRSQKFLNNLGINDYSVTIWDQRVIEQRQRQPYEEQGVIFLDALIATMREFVDNCDLIFVSAGVDTKKLHGKEYKLINELDVFAQYYTGKSVAITGTLGKTTVALLTASLLSAYRNHEVPAIGNIGLPLLSSLTDQPTEAVLELSSFQLEHNRFFAPDIAVLTNIYPNHLDRHVSLSDYFAAKAKIFSFQQAGQTSILSWELLQGELSSSVVSLIKKLSTNVLLVTSQDYTVLPLDLIQCREYRLLSLHDGNIQLVTVVNGIVDTQQTVMPLASIPTTTFLENWLVTVAIGIASGIAPQDFAPLNMQDMPVKYPRHRLEHFATMNNVFFYNDSKATVAQATEAAAAKLAQQGRPLVIILGGLSKGADRSQLVRKLQQIGSVKKIYAFGKERHLLAGAECYETLDLLLDSLFTQLEPGDQVLFSPSGASFDIFNNFEHRGDVFKELVLKRTLPLN